MLKASSSRRVNDFAEYHATTECETVVPFHVADATKANFNRSTDAAQRARRRDQEACRNYWQRLYGIEAEYRSRGGIGWLN